MKVSLLFSNAEYPLLVGTTLKTSSKNSTQVEPQTLGKQEDSVSEEIQKSVQDCDQEEETMTSPAKCSTTSTIDPKNAESTDAFRKLVINQPLFTRKVAMSTALSMRIDYFYVIKKTLFMSEIVILISLLSFDGFILELADDFVTAVEEVKPLFGKKGACVTLKNTHGCFEAHKSIALIPIGDASLERCAPEFVRCASELLPPMDTEGDVPLEVCRLADSLDEIIVTIGSQIEDILKYLPDERKALALPLLVQAICLHPDGAVRDKLLRTLFNLFTDSSEMDTSKVEMKRIVTILRQCRDLAKCLGPSRIESELLPQIWSQLNERPSIYLRKVLLFACGVIAPATPVSTFVYLVL
ncbi:unnamed protein product [Rodentolepis nana]|uniref:Maestro heat-like repeat-containing protein family member 7 n=1 Tax=Rodentolepis nana TaxID=102285 RepID=A0A0R3U0T2_RODNA|nr:unnamed protein product [Rodentolepis nana]